MIHDEWEWAEITFPEKKVTKRVERTPESVARWARIHAGITGKKGKPYKVSTGPEEKFERGLVLRLPHNVWTDFEIEAVLYINDVKR